MAVGELLEVANRAVVGDGHEVGEADFERAGKHTESGPYGVRSWLAIYTAHPLDHASQISAVLGTAERTPR